MKRANETLVGAAVLGALALLVAGSIWLSQLRVGGFDQLAGARFRTIGGIKNGSPVMLRGVRIGRVLSITLGERNWVNVQLAIRADVRVPPRPAAIISSTTLFGDWAVDITGRDNLPNDPDVRRQVDEAVAAGPDRWPGATLPDIGELTAQAGRIASDIALIASRVEDAFDSTSAARLRGAFLDLSVLSRRMSQIATRQQEALVRIGDNLDTGTASLARTAQTLERTVRRADSATNREQLARILNRTDSAAGDLRDVASNLRGITGTVAAQQAALGRIIVSTDSVMARIERGQGTLGKLASDSTLYTESVGAVRSLREMLQDMRQNPRRYFSFSVF